MSTRTLERPIAGFERVWAYSHTELQGAYDMIMGFSLDEPRTLARWRRAWIRLAKEQPLLHAQFQSHTNTIQTSLPMDWERWCDWTLRTVPITDSWTVQDGLDHCLRVSAFHCVTLTLFHRHDEVKHVVVSCNHVVADAGVVLELAKRALAMSVEPDGMTDVITAPKLPPTVYEATGCSRDDEKVTEWLAKVKPSHGLTVLPFDTSSFSTLWRKTHSFPFIATLELLQLSHAKGFSVTAFVYSAICHAVMAANPPSSFPVDFACPMQPVSKVPQVAERPWLYSAMSTAPVAWVIEEGESVAETARKINAELIWARETSIGPLEAYITTILSRYEAKEGGGAPSNGLSFPTLNSLSKWSLDGVSDINIATRSNRPTLGVHAYTVNGSLTVSFAWCPGRFDDRELSVFWDTFIKLLTIALLIP